MIWFVILGIAVAALPFVIEARKPNVGAARRAGQQGHLAQLSAGGTWYRWIGPARGPVVVAIHGLSTPSIAWDGIAESLGKIGYRVLVYDLYGRGLSDAPAGPQDRAFFLRQLSELLAHESVEDNLTLMGYSMGGSIATAFAAAHPERMHRVILLAPAGIEMRESRFSQICRTIPFFGDWLHHGIGALRMRAAIGGAGQTRVHDAQRNELHRRGFLPAVLASRRGMLDETLEPAHRAIAKADIPVIAIWGDADQVIPLSALGKLAQLNRVARLDVVKGADHALPFSHVDEVSALLREILIDEV